MLMVANHSTSLSSYLDQSPRTSALQSKQSQPPIVLSKVLHDLDELTSEYGPNHTSVAEAWNALGLVRLHMQRDAHAAIECHSHALTIYRQHTDDTSTAVTLSDLGRCYERLALTEEALELYQEALVLMKSTGEMQTLQQSVERAVARLGRR